MRFGKKHIKLIVTVALSVLVVVLLYENFRAPQERVDHQVDIRYSIDDPQFMRSLGHLLGPPIVGGNKVQAFYNGDEIFPAMLNAIHSAKETISFESYIYLSGDIGNRFVDALVERSEAGVKVHMLIDWFGSQTIKEEYIERLRKAKVEVEYYRPLAWYNLTRMNNRSHRKILVIDGRIGFTGGVGISDEWSGNGEDPKRWRDSQFMIEGPAALYMQAAFMDNWLKIRPEVHHSEKYFPQIPPQGNAFAQVFLSSPNEGSASMRLMYMMVVAAAKKNLRISSAYFVPDDLAIKEIVQARERGVDVEIIVPGSLTDAQIVRQTSKGLWRDLLKAGVKIYEYQAAKYHCKVMIADDIFVSVGSTNFDDRSFRLNDEANLNVIDKNFALKEVMAFEKDKERSKIYTLEMWEQRGPLEKIAEKIASLLKSQI